VSVLSCITVVAEQPVVQGAAAAVADGVALLQPALQAAGVQAGAVALLQPAVQAAGVQAGAVALLQPAVLGEGAAAEPLPEDL
jgi:hypothetical protein